MTIYKYPLKTVDEQRIMIPKGSEILTVQMQNGIPCLWALVNPDEIKEEKIFLIFGTGNPIPENLEFRYIGTYQTHGGQLVFHVFEYAGQ